MKAFTRYLVFLFCLLLTICPNPILAAEESKMEVFNRANVKFTGDYEAIKDRRIIRFLIPYSRTFFFFDGATPKGLGYEVVQLFEKYVNEREKTKTVKIIAIIIPTPREKLLEYLEAGLGDIAVGNLTITTHREEIVDFCDPMLKGVDEVLVTAKNNNKITSLEELSGKNIHVRKSSSYYDSLLHINKQLENRNLAPINIIIVDEHLEDEDILEMVNAYLIKYSIVDNHKAKFWATIFDNIKVHDNIVFRTGGEIAWAIRKNSPQLKGVVNTFVGKNKKGTLIGNVLFNRYLKSTNYITNSFHSSNVQKFKDLSPYFADFGTQYDIDHLFLVALGYQESQLDQQKVSRVGAIGVMQLMPSTAKDKNVNIPSIDKVNDNIHAGTKYLRFIMDRYFPESSGIDTFNRTLFTIA